ncbi:hypothetical protein ACM66B_001967 [Microbotryomycetes sp. NB124-2]
MYSHKDAQARGKGVSHYNSQFKPPRPATGVPISVPREGSRDQAEHKRPYNANRNNWNRPGNGFDRHSNERSRLSHEPTEAGYAGQQLLMHDDFGMSHADAAAREVTASRLNVDGAKNSALARVANDNHAKLDKINEIENKKQAQERKRKEERVRKRREQMMSSSFAAVASASSGSAPSVASASFYGPSPSSKSSVALPKVFSSAPDMLGKKQKMAETTMASAESNENDVSGKPDEVDLS